MRRRTINALLKMEDNVSVGGWRQWFELGSQEDGRFLLEICRSHEEKSHKVRALEEMLKFFHKIGLLMDGSHTECQCICSTCEGFGHVESSMDDVSCPSCDGTGETWSGRLSKHGKSLDALTEKYLSIKGRETFAEELAPEIEADVAAGY